MAELMLMKTPSGALAPVDEDSAALIAKLKIGQGVKAEIKRARNLAFHRKVFSLFKLAFDAWEPQAVEYKGQSVEKDFDRFRKDLTVLAGHHNTVINIRGEVRVEAKSLSFANMPEEEFQTVYKGLLNVVWRMVLKDAGYLNAEAVNNVVEQLLGYE